MLSPEQLQMLRMRHNISQTELGKEMDITKNYISLMENRKREFTEAQYSSYINSIYKIVQDRIQNKYIEEDKDNKNEISKK